MKIQQAGTAKRRVPYNPKNGEDVMSAIETMSDFEVTAVGGGDVSKSEVLAVGSAVAGLGAVALAAVGSPILAPAVAVYTVTSGVLALAAAIQAMDE